MAPGRFIVLEGGEGSGKSTQAALLADRLGALLTREPGGTELGERLRSLILDHPDGPPPSERAETLMLLAARAQHVDQVILPALRAGRDVVCDRWEGSTLAYQGYGRGLDVGQLTALSGWAAGGLRADVVLLLSVPPAEAARRRRARPGGDDRIEAEGEAFLDRVADGFEVLAAQGGWRRVDGLGTVEEVAARVAEAVGG